MTGSRIEWVRSSCRLLGAIGEEFDRSKPFDGLRIGTAIHLEPKTVALLLVLARGGADVITVTGARDVVTADDLPLFADGVVLANAGHFPFEIDVGGLDISAATDG